MKWSKLSKMLLYKSIPTTMCIQSFLISIKKILNFCIKLELQDVASNKQKYLYLDPLFGSLIWFHPLVPLYNNCGQLWICSVKNPIITPTSWLFQLAQSLGVFQYCFSFLFSCSYGFHVNIQLSITPKYLTSPHYLHVGKRSNAL